MERKIQLEVEVSKQLVHKIGKNDECVRKICKLLGRDQSEEHLEDASMKYFSKLLNADLESFILVRNKDNQVKSKLPKKGKLEDAIKEEQNLIKLAFDSNLIENFIKKNFRSTLSNRNENDQDEQVDEQFQNHTIILTDDNSGEIRKASDLIQNKDWMNDVKNCFNSKDKLLIRVVNESLTIQADEYQVRKTFNIEHY